MKRRQRYVGDPRETAPSTPHPNVPPNSCSPDRRIAARHVEQILREAFKFPVSLDANVTAAADRIAAELLAATHEITALFWNDAEGEA